MEQKDEMNTLTSVLEKLRVKKIDNEFRWASEGFTANKGKIYKPDELTIIKTYRFEGSSDPGDSSILYIIEASDGLRGARNNDIKATEEDLLKAVDNGFIDKIRIEQQPEFKNLLSQLDFLKIEKEMYKKNS